jgi:tetratricopeptide (TPR) repeat protein
MKTRMFGLAAVALALILPLGVQAQGGMPGAPYASGKKMTTDDALKQAPKDDPSLAPLEKAFTATASALKKSPKDAKAKKAYVEAAYKYGKTCEDNANNKLSRPVQYRAALALYRKALAVDPHHKPSLDEKKKIDDIYQHMPGGIPK